MGQRNHGGFQQGKWRNCALISEREARKVDFAQHLQENEHNEPKGSQAEMRAA